MADQPSIRLNKVLRELNISLAKNGCEIDARPTTKISESEYQVLLDGFQTDKSKKVGVEKRKEQEALRKQQDEERQVKRDVEEKKQQKILKAKAEKLELKTVGKIDIDKKSS